MLWFSTNNPNLRDTLKNAVLNGMPSDGGLFMPEKMPVLKKIFLNSLKMLSFQEIAFEIAKNLLEDDVPHVHLRILVQDSCLDCLSIL